jgi:drug/metabolite transporter superfamily protein YnfA
LIQTAIALLAAALLEAGGDALARIGLREQPPLLAAGALTLFAYGVVVNQGRLNFGRLIRVYIAVFFLISQILAFAFFREVPAYKTIAGGLLIVIGGAVIML